MRFIEVFKSEGCGKSVKTDKSYVKIGIRSEDRVLKFFLGGGGRQSSPFVLCELTGILYHPPYGKWMC